MKLVDLPEKQELERLEARLRVAEACGSEASVPQDQLRKLIGIAHQIGPLQEQALAQAVALEFADSLAMAHRANRMAGQPTPALDAYDAAKARIREVIQPGPRQ